MISGISVSHSNLQPGHEVAQLIHKDVSSVWEMNKQISHWMHQSPSLLPFISVYYFSTHSDVVLQSYTMSYTMISKHVLMLYFADVLHYSEFPGRFKKKKIKKEKNPHSFGDHGPRDLEPFENFSMTLQSLSDWRPLIFTPNKVASQQMHIFKPHQHRMYTVLDDALAVPRAA